MKTIEIFDPAMCCPTGLCGTNINPELMRIAVVIETLKKQDTATAHKTLTDQYGIGNKVAACIALFALHHVDAFPIDTHVKKILAEHYPDGFPYEKYKGYAGILQQYMFFYDL